MQLITCCHVNQTEFISHFLQKGFRCEGTEQEECSSEHIPLPCTSGTAFNPFRLGLHKQQHSQLLCEENNVPFLGDTGAQEVP